jgi:arginine dihydrolase
MSAKVTKSSGPRFLMCRPHHFSVSYSINPWMNPQDWRDKGGDLARAAQQQWVALHDALLTRGASITFVDPEPGLPDLVFTANAAIVLDGKVLLSRFRHPERQGEEPVFARAFDMLRTDAAIDTLTAPPDGMILEGAGDCIWDRHRGQFWMGCGQRSDRAAATFVGEYFGVDCVALELADASYYHLDTAFCALPSGDVIYYPDAFVPKARGVIEERVEPARRIALDAAEAASFAANTVPLDRSLVMSSCTEALRRRLEERGYTVVTTPLHAFLRSGGSACCLTLRLDHQSPRAKTNGRA